MIGPPLDPLSKWPSESECRRVVLPAVTPRNGNICPRLENEKAILVEMHCTTRQTMRETHTKSHHFLASLGESFQELNLNVSTEELLSSERAFTYTDMSAMLESGRTVAWLTPHAAIVRNGGLAVLAWDQQLDGSYHYCFNADGKDIIFFIGRSPEHLFFDCWQ
jgi:hypothetical protein